MKALTLLAVVAIASLVSCTSQSTQAKIDQASTKYESTTGITTGQTVSLLGKWWMDLQQARALNALAKSPDLPVSPSAPIQATQASPLMDYTSAKAVLEGVNPQASAIPHAPAEPPAAAPAPGPEPGTIRRSDAHHRLQIASN